jgi:uncharacterized membrane protein YdjX (TVP38/TMEM64 family)
LAALNINNLLLTAIEWVNGLGGWGAIAYIGIYIIATLAFLPALLLTLGAGLLFGIGWGSLYVLIGATLGAIAAFLVGRYLLRDWVSRKIAGNSKFLSIDQAVGRSGFKIVLLTRLSPLFPFNLLNYAYGVTSVSFRDYALASVGMIPGTIMYVYIGSLAGSIATLGHGTKGANPQLQLAIQLLGFVATLIATIYITKVSRQALAVAVNSHGATDD